MQWSSGCPLFLRHAMEQLMPTFNGAADAHFKLVLIDEAAQDTEPTTLIPITRNHISGRVTLLGDPCQLGLCVTSGEAEQMGFGHTLFKQLYNMHIP
uniref:DNA2/NAM7 helicase helicase domain-containing protein n=1 Tax=Romanomermis culicivorax TaxID=13658 RepID=A0A915IF04_ROMCU